MRRLSDKQRRMLSFINEFIQATFIGICHIKYTNHLFGNLVVEVFPIKEFFFGRRRSTYEYAL